MSILAKRPRPGVAASFRCSFRRGISRLVVVVATALPSGLSLGQPAERAAESNVPTAPPQVRRAQLGETRLYAVDRQAVVEWETTLELGAVSYRVYRQEADGWTLINEQPIVALDSFSGGRYRIADPKADVTRPHRYRWEMMPITGRNEVLGTRELSPLPADPAVLASATLREERVRRTPVAVSQTSRQAALAGPPAGVDLPNSSAGVKILTKVPGIHFLSASKLTTLLGQSESTIAGWLNAGTVALYCGGFDAGHKVSYVPGTAYVSSGVTGPGLFFYAESVWDNYTTTNVYWLRSGQNTYSTVDMGHPTPTTIGSYNATLGQEADYDKAMTLLTQSPGTPQGEVSDESFWFWKQLTANSANDTWSRSFELEKLSAGEASIRIKFLGGTYTQQKITVLLNGQSLDEYALPDETSLTWSGIGTRTVVFSFPMTLLKDRSLNSANLNNLTVKALLPLGSPVCQVYLDRYDVTYRRQYRLKTDARAVEVIADGTPDQAITISDLPSATDTSNLAVFDVTDPKQPRKVTGFTVSAATEVTLKASTGTSRYAVGRLDIASGQVLPAPTSLSLIYPSNLDDPATRASYVIITHPSFSASAASLAAHRSASLRTKTVLTTDIYNDFGFGKPSPHALKAFLTAAHNQWAVPPRYAVLLGDGTYDHRNIDAMNDDFVPPLMLKTPYGLFTSDSRLGDVLNTGEPRVIVGRLPISTAAEFQVLFTKIQNYEAKLVTQLNALLMADQPDSAGDFIEGRDLVAGYLNSRYDCTLLDPGYSPPLTQAMADSLGLQMKAALEDPTGGMDLFSYIGHGAQNQIGLIPYLEVTDPLTKPSVLDPSLANSSRQPVFVAMTCVVGSYSLPGYSSLAEGLLRPGNWGAVAVIAPTGLSQDYDASVINGHLMRLFATSNRDRLGDLLAQAFTQYARNPPAGASTPFWIYNLLGDPALRVLRESP